MKILLSLFAIFTALLFFPFNVSAASKPVITSPTNGATVSDTSPELTWNYTDSCPESGSCFLVEVDDSPTFDSPSKSNYTNNSNYSPSLSEGIWNWRVKAKDASGNWSDWITSSFTISPSATSSQTSPSPSMSPSDNTSTPTPNPQTNEASFTISGMPSTLDGTNSTQAEVNLHLPSNPNTVFYLKGAFIKPGSSNYFGQTKVNGNWINNGSSYSSQLKITTDPTGSWQGLVDIMPDITDSGYTGSGNYTFKVARYSASGSGPTWSNETTIALSGNPATPASSPKATSSPKVSASPKISTTPKAASNPTTAGSSNYSGSLIENSNPLSHQELELPKIAGEATFAADILTPPNSPQFLSLKNQFNWWYIFSGFTFLIGTLSALIVKYKPHLIKQWLSHPLPQKIHNNWQLLLQTVLKPKAESLP